MLTKNAIEFKILIKLALPTSKIVQISVCERNFIDENYISVTKYEINDWQEITLELRSYQAIY
jgi:hypothetical protein